MKKQGKLDLVARSLSPKRPHSKKHRRQDMKMLSVRLPKFIWKKLDAMVRSATKAAGRKVSRDEALTMLLSM